MTSTSIIGPQPALPEPAVTAAGAADGAALDPLWALAFMEHQAGLLRDALARPGEPGGVERALRRQEWAHGTWLALVGHAQRDGHSGLAELMTALYGFHGRVAGTLARGCYPWLPTMAQQRLRLLLIEELHRLTGRAIEALVSCALARETGDPTP